ncbi:trehalose-phosphatase [Elusimicrobiota bacterium]
MNKLEDIKNQLLINRGDSCCLFIGLDFDGTLAPIVSHPRLAKLSSPIKKALKKLADRNGIKIAIVSGRSLGNLKTKIDLGRLIYAGNHGLEIAAQNKTWLHPKAKLAKNIIQELAEKLSWEIEDYSGAWVENKNVSLSLHYRSVASKRAVKTLKRTVFKFLKPHKNKIMILQGKKVFDIRPCVKWNKGDALLKVARNACKKCRFIFIGDDVTDEEAFKTLKNKAVTVKVGFDGSTRARYRIKDHVQVQKLLELILKHAK